MKNSTEQNAARVKAALIRLGLPFDPPASGDTKSDRWSAQILRVAALFDAGKIRRDHAAVLLTVRVAGDDEAIDLLRAVWAIGDPRQVLRAVDTLVGGTYELDRVEEIAALLGHAVIPLPECHAGTALPRNVYSEQEKGAFVAAYGSDLEPWYDAFERSEQRPDLD